MHTVFLRIKMHSIGIFIPPSCRSGKVPTSTRTMENQDYLHKHYFYRRLLLRRVREK